VPTDAVDLDAVTFTVSVNGVIRQRGETRDMVHSIREIVASFSATLPLHAGDVILTGSPAGVGAACDPPVFLEPGDTVVAESPELGRLSNRFVASTSPRSPDEQIYETEPPDSSLRAARRSRRWAFGRERIGGFAHPLYEGSLVLHIGTSTKLSTRGVGYARAGSLEFAVPRPWTMERS